MLARVDSQQWSLRKGNCCADKLAAFGVSSKVFIWWNVTLNFIHGECIKNRLGLPNCRSCNLYVPYFVSYLLGGKEVVDLLLKREGRSSPSMPLA
ncbi:hypothetical protein Lal_00012035 [Lupinus albus]|nr:hypothetical protein Lal_00012035 [Lupinus albus]